MLDLKFITGQTTEVEKSLRKRAAEKLIPVLNEIVAQDVERRNALQTVELLKAKRNQASQEIARAKKAGEDTSAIMAEMKQVADTIKDLDSKIVPQISILLLVINVQRHTRKPRRQAVTLITKTVFIQVAVRQAQGLREERRSEIREANVTVAASQPVDAHSAFFAGEQTRAAQCHASDQWKGAGGGWH